MKATIFCNTCSQALCPDCKQITHSAKMFSRHEVVQVNQRTNKNKKKCGKNKN